MFIFTGHVTINVPVIHKQYAKRRINLYLKKREVGQGIENIDRKKKLFVGLFFKRVILEGRTTNASRKAVIYLNVNIFYW